MGSDFIVLFFGYVSNDNYQRLADSSDQSPIAVNELTTTKDNKWLLILTTPDREPSARKLLDAVSFKEFPLKEIAEQLNVDDPMAFLDKHLEGHRKAINSLERVARNTLNENKEEYKHLYSQLYTMQRVYDVCKGRGSVSDMFLISGWLPDSSLENVQKTVETEAPNTTLIIEETKNLISHGIRVPTLLKIIFFLEHSKILLPCTASPLMER